MTEALGSGVIRLTGDNAQLKATVEDSKRSVKTLGDTVGTSMQAGSAKAQRSVQSVIVQLQRQATTVGKTSSELKLMELAQRGATDAQLEAARAALGTVDAYRRQQAEIRKAAQEAREAARAQAAAAESTATIIARARGAIAGAAGLGIAREFIQAADAMASLNARVQLVTATTNDFLRVQARLIALSQDTRTGLGQTADLFTSLTRSTEALGVSQDDVLGVTKTINQALVVSGANAQSAAAALVQLGQGFASGTLRGEELNSVLEQAPRLARAIADGLGVTVGQLRQLGQDGKLTAEQVFKAIQKGGQAINAEFERMPLTVGQATTQASSALQVLAGAMDTATGTSKGLASAISGAAAATIDWAAELKRASEGAKDVGVLAEAFLTVSETITVLGVNAKYVLTGVGREIGGIAAQVAALARGDFRGFSAISDAMKADAEKARAEVDRVTAEILARRPNAQELLRRQEERGFNPLKTAAAGKAASTGGGKQKDVYGDELKALRERLALLGKEGELEKLNAEIQLGKYAALTPKQILSLRYAAAAIDQAKDEAAALQAEATARDAATEALTKMSQAKLQALMDFERNNNSLREEIELMGADARARAVIENARLQSLITTREQQIAEEELAGVSEERLQVLQREVDLLKERQQLNMTKAIKESERQVKETGEKTSETLSASISEGLLDGFRNGRRLSDIFRNELKAQFAKLVLQPVIQPVVAAGQDAAAGIFSKLLGAASSFLGGGLSIDTAGIGITNASTGSLVSLGLGAGRAAGGPVYPNTLHPVNERGPELLTVGSRQYLMMGAQGGNVTPNSQISGMPTIINQTTGRVDKATMVTLPDGERALLLQEAVTLAERRVNGNLSNPNSTTSRAMARNYRTERNR